jgi:exonuclease SbcC
MCYRDNTEVLDLTGVHLACLSGENGAGKSALLEAITWALWGRARDRVIDDELISKGATEMEVDFQFMLNGDAYRVIRKRAVKGKAGTTMLEVQIGDGEPGAENWRTISGATVRESQARIGELLKIDYETFVNSAFIMQGKADSFTVKTPTDRKRVLAEILGLEQYDVLEESAKDEAHARRLKMADLENNLHRIDMELLQRPAYAKRLEEVEEEQANRQTALLAVRNELRDIASNEQSLANSEKRLAEIRDRIAKRERSMDVAKTRIVRDDDKRKSFELLVAQREEIEAGYAELQELQERDRGLNEEKSRLHALQVEQMRIEKELDVEKARLESEKKQREDQIRRLGQSLQGRAVVESQLSETLDKLNRLARLVQQHEDTRCERERLDVRVQTLTRERNTLAEDGKVIRQKLDLLLDAHAKSKDHVGCPLCGTGLSEDALRRVRESYQQDIDDRRREYGDKQRELDDANKQLVAAISLYTKEQEELKPLEMQREREAALKQKLAGIDQAEQDMVKEEAALVLVKTRLADGDFAHEARKHLLAVAAQMKSLSYDAGAHAGVARRLEELRECAYERRYYDLRNAERDLPVVLADLEGAQHALAELRVEQESDRDEEELLVPQAAQLDEVREQRREKALEEVAIASEVDVLIEERGELKNKLARCDALQEDKQKYSAEYQEAVDERQIYEELAYAFGKKGIQAMIIENIIPEVEEEANALLHRMTDGRMSVQMETQKDAKSGKSVIETLDIRVADEMGVRGYEMYSGGEAFRVNFAVRIALSKLLARRAGTQLQTLVIDEGFGSQDGQGREKLVGAIRSIQDDFEKILVITHIEELKDEFPTRINIVKTGMGSKIVTSES